MRRASGYRPVLVGVIVVILSFLVGWNANGDAPRKVAWEYKVVVFNGYGPDAERALNQQAAEGWELVVTEPSSRTPGSTFCYLKRAR